jgi:two-component system sensor histidine kinase DesK
VREGVTNVIRHSGASSCRIELRQSPEAVRLSITDNGTACSEPQRGGRAGTGIAGLTERISALGGTVVAERLREDGFRLVVEIPVRGLPAGTPATVSPVRATPQPLVLGEQP